jgi:DNA-binding CsgD family transcriptional regulator
MATNEGHAKTKLQHLLATWRLLLTRSEGVTTQELAREIGVSRQTAWRYALELGAEQQGRHWILQPTEDDFVFARSILQRERPVPVTAQMLRRLYHDEGMTLEEIAATLALTPQTVHYHMRKSGIERRRRQRIDPETVMRMHQAGMSLNAIGRNLHTSASAIQRIVRKRHED